MQRQPNRASSVKALQSIKENSLGKKSSKSKNKVTARTENVISLYGVKRQPSPSGIVPPNPKRNALGNITNAVVSVKPVVLKPQELHKGKISKISKVPQRRSQRLKQKEESRKSSPSLDMSVSSYEDVYSQTTEDIPVPAVQNFLQATTLSDDSLRSDECVLDEDEDIKFKSTQKDYVHRKDIDADLVKVDITKLRNLIVSKINDNYAGLYRLIETSLPNFTIEMFQARLISEGIRDKSTPDNILKEFINGMDWIHNQLDMEEHCKKFLEVCNKIGGSCIPASKTLKYQWIESVKQEMGVSLSLEY